MSRTSAIRLAAMLALMFASALVYVSFNAGPKQLSASQLLAEVHPLQSVTVSIDAVGGVAPGAPRALKGKIELKSASGVVRTIRVTDAPRPIKLPRGNYRTHATSPGFDSGHANCDTSAGPKVLITRHSHRLRYICQVK